MPETRYTEIYKNGKLVDKEPYQVSDEQLADEAEAREIQQIKDTLEQTWTTAQAAAILKKLIRRLLKKGILP